MNIKFKKLANNLILAAVLLFLGFVASRAMGLGRTGFEAEQIFQQFLFYGVTGGIGLLGIVSLYIASLITNREDSLGDSICFNSPGEAPAIKGNFFRNPLRLLFLSLVIGGILGVMSSYANIQFTGVGQLKEQFTVLDNIIFSSLLVPIAENLDFAFFIALVIFSIRIIARKNNWSLGNFTAFSILTSVAVGGLYGVINHMSRYQGQEVALTIVFFFWAVCALISTLTGSFIPAWIFHVCNNLFFMLKASFSSETSLIIAIAIIIVNFILFALTFRNKQQTNFAK